MIKVVQKAINLEAIGFQRLPMAMSIKYDEEPKAENPFLDKNGKLPRGLLEELQRH